MFSRKEKQASPQGGSYVLDENKQTDQCKLKIPEIVEMPC